MHNPVEVVGSLAAVGNPAAVGSLAVEGSLAGVGSLPEVVGSRTFSASWRDLQREIQGNHDKIDIQVFGPAPPTSGVRN